jgi:CDP-diacylglycerol--glycerol-3-phosphate 3-phosphatidyltransferase
MAGVAAAFFVAQTYEKTAVILCIVAAALDAFDGWYARTFAQCSKLGKHLDPLADKLLMAVVFVLIAFKMRSLAVWVLVILIALREFGMTLFRAYSLRHYKKFIPANRWGKAKMIIQSLGGLVVIAYAYFLNGGFDINHSLVLLLLIIIAFVSYYSAIVYIISWRNTSVDASESPMSGEEAKAVDGREKGRMVAG